MRALEHIAVIILTTTVVVSLMTGYAIYQEQVEVIANWEASFAQLANACGVQYVPQGLQAVY